LRTPQARGEFNGRISLLDEPGWSMDGVLDMRASQAATVLSMLRVSPGGEPVTGPIDLHATVNKNASRFQISGLTLKIGGETITGKVDADLSGDRPKGTIDVEAPSASLPKIAAYLVDWDRNDFASEIASVTSGSGSSWPKQAFALSALTTVDGSLKLTAPRIDLADGVSLSGGLLSASINDGKLTVSELSGQIYGGRLVSSGSLTRLKGHAGGELTLKLENLDLAALSRAHGGGEIVEGSADFTLSVESEGLSPSGLASMFSGTGEISLDSGKLRGLSHTALKDAADTYLGQEIPDKDDLERKLQNDFFEGQFGYAAMTAPVTVRDGLLRVTDVRFTDGKAVAEADLIVDLNSLRFDSEWVVMSPEKVEGDTDLPPVRLVFAGPLAQFSAAKADLNADGFERFLTIRRMDADMERLERLQKERGLRPGQDDDRPQASGRKAPAARGETARAEPAPGPAEQDATVSEQSLLRAPSIELEQPPQTAVTPAPPQEKAAVGWSTGVETTIEEAPANVGEGPVADEQPAPPQPGGGSFEDQIRKVLRSQQTEGQPSYR
jgi:hypothetical protein